MSHIEIAVNGAKKIESFLEQALGATGRGLHEKLTSVESKIPNELQKQIRYVASIRNSIVHESDTNSMQDPVVFEATVGHILNQLHQHSVPLRQNHSVPAGTPPAAAEPSGGLFSFICDGEAAPWFFMIGGVIGFIVGAVNSIGIVLSLLLGLLIGTFAAVFSRLIYILLGIGVVAFIVYAAYDVFSPG